jgi:hypothetical protein
MAFKYLAKKEQRLHGTSRFQAKHIVVNIKWLAGIKIDRERLPHGKRSLVQCHTLILIRKRIGNIGAELKRNICRRLLYILVVFYPSHRYTLSPWLNKHLSRPTNIPDPVFAALSQSLWTVLHLKLCHAIVPIVKSRVAAHTRRMPCTQAPPSV